MWKACLRVVKEQARQAKHVLDRFHIVQKLGKAIDKLRAAEAKRLKAQGEEPVLKWSRWLLLKHPEGLTEKQEAEAGRAAPAEPAHGAGLLLRRGGGHEQQSQGRPKDSVRIPLLQGL